MTIHEWRNLKFRFLSYDATSYQPMLRCGSIKFTDGGRELLVEVDSHSAESNTLMKVSLDFKRRYPATMPKGMTLSFPVLRGDRSEELNCHFMNQSDLKNMYDVIKSAFANASLGFPLKSQQVVRSRGKFQRSTAKPSAVSPPKAKKEPISAPSGQRNVTEGRSNESTGWSRVKEAERLLTQSSPSTAKKRTPLAMLAEPFPGVGRSPGIESGEACTSSCSTPFPRKRPPLLFTDNEQSRVKSVRKAANLEDGAKENEVVKVLTNPFGRSGDHLRSAETPTSVKRHIWCLSPTSSSSIRPSRVGQKPFSVTDGDEGSTPRRKIPSIVIPNGEERKTGSARGGFANLGNSCYMNASLQALFSMNCFAKELYKVWEALKKRSDALPEGFEMLRSLSDLASRPLDCSASEEINLLRAVKSSFKRNGCRFSMFNQEDAQEFISEVLGQVKEECARILSENGNVDGEMRALPQDPVTSNFGFTLLRNIQCEKCGRSNSRSETATDLAVDIEQRTSFRIFCDEENAGSVSVQSLLDDSLASEQVELKCELCGCDKAQVTQKFETIPRCLIVYVKRYTFNLSNSKGSKREDRVEIPLYLTLDGHCAHSSPKFMEVPPSTKKVDFGLTRKRKRSGSELSDSSDSKCAAARRCLNEELRSEESSRTPSNQGSEDRRAFCEEGVNKINISETPPSILGGRTQRRRRSLFGPIPLDLREAGDCSLPGGSKDDGEKSSPPGPSNVSPTSEHMAENSLAEDFLRATQEENEDDNPEAGSSPFLEDRVIPDLLASEDLPVGAEAAQTIREVEASEGEQKTIQETEASEREQIVRHLSLITKEAKARSRVNVGSSLSFRPASRQYRLRCCGELSLKLQEKDVDVYESTSEAMEISFQDAPTNIPHVSGDGNCLFRTLAFCITGGSDKGYAKVREKIVMFEVEHSEIFRKLKGATEEEWEAHINTVASDETWGSDVEIVAFASLLSLNVWTFYRGRWICYRPRISLGSDGSVTEISLTDSLARPKENIYLVNDDCHFDPVVNVSNALLLAERKYMDRLQKIRVNSEKGTMQPSYRLLSIVSHLGGTSSSGHYVCDRWNERQKRWYTCDDEKITEDTEEEIRESRRTTGYIFFYLAKELLDIEDGEQKL